MKPNSLPVPGGAKDFLTLSAGGQLFGLPVLQVQDVLSEQKITRVPLAPCEIAGTLNLRGRVVTAIDLRRRLDMAPLAQGMKTMYIVVEHQSELYSIIVDGVGDVLSLADRDFENTPSTVAPNWRALSTGIYRLRDQLLIILDVAAMLDAFIAKDDSAVA